MANICDNKMYVLSEVPENIKYIKEYMKNWNGADIEDIDDDSFEVYFSSRWDFPLTEMNEMVEKIPDKEDIFIRVLSVEESTCYCAFHLYEGKEWEYQ